VFAVNPSVPANSLQELNRARACQARRIAYGTPGAGTTHISSARFQLSRKIVWCTAVPGRGAGDHRRGRRPHPLVLANVSEVLPFAKSGRCGRSRCDREPRRAMPDVRRCWEVGYPEANRRTGAGSSCRPARRRPPIHAFERRAGAGAAQRGDTGKAQTYGMSPAPGTPGNSSRILQSESARYAKFRA